MITNLLTYTINSNNKKENETHSDFSIPVNIPNNLKDQINACSITLINCPKSYYNIAYNHNTFELKEVDLFGTITELIITIPIGNYNKFQLYTAISTQMTNSSVNNVNYVCQDLETLYDSGKIKITCD
jgi:hypothetical protein